MNPFEESKKYFKTPLQEFIFFDKYSRYNHELGRREAWTETVDRTVSFLKTLSNDRLDQELYNKIRESILNMDVMPSMRLLAMAGPAAERNHFSIYNCSYVNISSIRALVDIMYLSMAGVGVGYSVEKRYTDLLPVVPNNINEVATKFVIEDSSEGWADALKHHITSLYNGDVYKFDYSNIRPSGSVLKTKGGRASGPEVLQECLDFITKTFLCAVGRKLTSIELHDIVCCIGFCSISGGVRRTALISLFDVDDQEMLHSKDGDDVKNYRWFANNSVVFHEEPSKDSLDSILNALFDGERGEPGFYFLNNAKLTAPKRRDAEKIVGLNPCGEVTLRDMETCNLSSVICRENDTVETLAYKAMIASVIGTIQSMADDFKNVDPAWKLNQQDERLLGVDLNGQMDCPVLRDDKYGHIHEFLKEIVLETNEKVAGVLGINKAAAATCVKPNGNSSQLVDSASGLHPRHAKYYIRNARVSVHSPVYKVLFEARVPMVPENGQDWSNLTTAVIRFPIKAPENSVTKNDMSAIDMCDFWKINKLYYTEMNPSITVNYHPHEKDDIKEWIWRNRNIIGAMTFLPHFARYENIPNQEISEDEYNKLMSEFPKIDWSRIAFFEEEDMTTASQESACLSGQCEI